MALNFANIVVEFLQQNPEQKFTAWEITNWIFETYPDECRQKQKRSTATSTHSITKQHYYSKSLLKLVRSVHVCRNAIQK